MLLRTVMVCSAGAGIGDFSGDFFVLGQMRRHGCVFTVSLNSAMLRPTGSSSRIVDFNLSDDSRKFCKVTSRLRFLDRSLLIFSMLVRECESEPSGAVKSERCSPKALNWARARFR